MNRTSFFFVPFIIPMWCCSIGDRQRFPAKSAALLQLSYFHTEKRDADLLALCCLHTAVPTL